jgi:hypothetical protein
MKRLLLLLPLVSFTFLDWQPFAVDQRATVEFPAKPTEAKAGAGKKVGRNRACPPALPERMTPRAIPITSASSPSPCARSKDS